VPLRWRPNDFTLLGVFAATAAGAAYALAGGHPAWLWVASAFLVLQWFGDSLDGTLARVRKSERPRYGYYLDHVTDAYSTAVIGVGIGLSHYVHFGLALGLASTLLLGWVGGRVAAGLGVASILFYVFVYTIWLKPRSAWNAVIGGAAGAASPIIADASVHGSVGVVGLALFAIVFFWQPPHVWAIALYRKRDYEAAGIPMLPSVIGDQPTRRRMLWYTLGLVPVTLAPVALGLLGPIYLAVALGMNAWFVGSALHVLRERSDAAARRMFHVSLAYLFSLFLAMNLELLLRS
jgi:protoheme IX farnesyltransferase